LHFIHSHRLGLQAIQRPRYSIHFQFTIPHALGFSVLTIRLLITDLSQSTCNFNSHMKSSCHSPNYFFDIILQLEILKTQLDYSRTLFYTPSTQLLLLYIVLYTVFHHQECAFIDPLPRNGRVAAWERVYRPVADQWIYTSRCSLLKSTGLSLFILFRGLWLQRRRSVFLASCGSAVRDVSLLHPPLCPERLLIGWQSIQVYENQHVFTCEDTSAQSQAPYVFLCYNCSNFLFLRVKFFKN
jgi:hypothetical protein